VLSAGGGGLKALKPNSLKYDRPRRVTSRSSKFLPPAVTSMSAVASRKDPTPMSRPLPSPERLYAVGSSERTRRGVAGGGRRVGSPAKLPISSPASAGTSLPPLNLITEAG